jgi:Porin subfamily
MKMIKSLVLGSAAALVAMGGAQAADLPVKAKAVEYVKVCSLYGAGFWYIPGTDTCIKLGGYLRAEVALGTNSDISGNFTSSSQGANAQSTPGQGRLGNYYTMRAREDLNVDTRTATEYGVVRTYFDGVFSWTTGNFVGTNSTTGTTAYSGTLATGASPTGTTAFNSVTLYGSGSGSVNSTDGNTSGGSLGVYYAYIQFAGFTMGKAVSQFDTPWSNYPANNFDGLVGGGGTVTGVNQFTYTAQFGNGVSLAVSAEDNTQYYQAGNVNLAGISGLGIGQGAYGSSGQGGSRSPNFVGQLRVDQAWGLFQANVAVKDNHVAYYGANETTGHPDDKWGWAAQVALSIKNIPTGPGDTLNIQAVYTDGATRYNFQNLAGSSFTMFSGATNGAYQSIGIAQAPDTFYTSNGGGSSQETVQTWGFRGGYTHNWDPFWNTSIYGAYAGVRMGSLATSAICTAFFTIATAGSTCNPNFNIAQAGMITRWTPVKNLTFSADLAWTHLDQKYDGNLVTPNPTNSAAGAIFPQSAKPSATYQLKDQDSVVLLLRAQRNW